MDDAVFEDELPSWTDRTRNGSFATLPASFATPSVRDPTRDRGFLSGIPGGPSEPLPNIIPLEGRVGIRLGGGEGCSAD